MQRAAFRGSRGLQTPECVEWIEWPLGPRLTAIRISMQNGNVELYGSVDSQADKDAAANHANTVPGVLSVKNFLQAPKQLGGRQN